MNTANAYKENILVVDHEVETLKIIKTTLSDEGYRVYCSQSTQGTNCILQRKPMALLIMSMSMPELNGQEFLQKIRLIDPSISVILIYRDDPLDVLIKSSQAGAQATLLKPFKTEELVKVVNQVLQKGRLAKESVRLKTLMPLFEVNKSILSDLNEEKIFNRIVRAVCIETRANKVSLMLLDESSNELIVKAALGLSKTMIDKSLDLSHDEISWSVIKTGKAILINAKPKPEHVTKDRLSAIVSSLCVPLIIKNKAIGVINCSKNASKVPFTEADLELLTILAGQVAIAIENARLFEDNKMHKDTIEIFLRRCLTAQEDEKKRISTELHDGLAQWLVSVSYFIQLSNGHLSASNFEGTRDGINRAGDILSRSIKELRRIILDLHPTVLAEFGLVGALRLHIESMGRDTGITPKFEITGDPKPLSTMLEIVLYRICLEALNNVWKHATASKVEINMKFEPETVSLRITDNGRGFDLGKVMKNKVLDGHMGLLSMYEKAGMVGGKLNINTAPGKGTEVCLIMSYSIDDIELEVNAESRVPEIVGKKEY